MAIGISQRVPRPRLDQSDPQPAADYQTALEKFAQLQARDGADVNPVCRSRLLAHNGRTARAVVLLHGVTNCPEQYAQLAPKLYSLGYNVLVPRIPRNGLADRMTEELKLLTAGEMRAFADAVVDIAAGLGETVTVMGLSGGGVLAAWMAQFRADVDTAIVIAPAIGIVASPAHLAANAGANRLVMHLMLRLPNLMTRRIIRYDGGLSHTYAGFATRGLGAMMRSRLRDAGCRPAPSACAAHGDGAQRERPRGQQRPRVRAGAPLACQARSRWPGGLRLPFPGEPGTDPRCDRPTTRGPADQPGVSGAAGSSSRKHSRR